MRGGRPAWSTAVGLGPIPYWFAGSNPAPRTLFLLSNYFQLRLYWNHNYRPACEQAVQGLRSYLQQCLSYHQPFLRCQQMQKIQLEGLLEMKKLLFL